MREKQPAKTKRRRFARRLPKRILPTAIFAFLFAFLLMSPALAEDIAYFDFETDFYGYAQTVAQLNQTSVTTLDESGTAQSPTCALLKSDGSEAFHRVLRGTSPLCVVEGPDNRCTAYYGSPEQADAAIERLSNVEGVVYAELDAEVSFCEETEGEGETGQGLEFVSWAAEPMGFGAYLPFAKNGGGETTVAVVDSGVARHPLIDGKMPSSGFDYIDADWDSTNDLFGHGTFVAGVVADCTRGAPVNIYPIRVLNAAGDGRVSNVINAVLEAARENADVINLSMESYILSQALDDAIQEAIRNGTAVVIAAGNSARDTSTVSPAHLLWTGAIVVGSAEKNGESVERAAYSNFGASVDLLAYGTGVAGCSRDGGYTASSGTSVSAPHVSAAAALLRLLRPGISPAGIEIRLREACEGEGGARVLNLAKITPDNMGFDLRSITLEPSESIFLPGAAYPIESGEAIAYTSANPDIAYISEQNELIALAPGTASISAHCFGLESHTFEVVVAHRETGPTIALPASLTRLEAEALRGAESVRNVLLPEGLLYIGEGALRECPLLAELILPSSLEQIGGQAFPQTVLLRNCNATAAEYARANGLKYIRSAEPTE